MPTFLQHVADDLRKKMGNDLSHVAVIFPNKRASLFLNEHLVDNSANGTSAAVWSPRYLTIRDLFSSLSNLHVADPIETVCRIYRLYVKLTGSAETLDFFYGWGERLLSDFDDVDKNMADAARLFRNLAEIKQLEDDTFIDEEQEQVLKSFFSDFSLKDNSHIRSKFLELWNVLLPLYNQLNASLAEAGKAYEGALFRSVVAGLQDGSITLPKQTTHYAFVGFNVLDKVEETLFTLLRDKGKALFYWDYDAFYTTDHPNFEAGTFLRSNLEKFPNELPADYFRNLLKEKDIEFVSAPTENVQARYVAPWLGKHLTADEKQTAVVLCNEHLLQPILHALPPEVKEANVTKGYPLHHTAAYRLVTQAMQEAADGRENGPWLEELTGRIREAAVDLSRRPDTLDKTLNTEAFFQTYTTLRRFATLMAEGWLAVTPTTLHKLIRQVLQQITIPFHGEPAAGLQVMGVLETRCLDFRNILMLSVNEGNLPQRVRDTSFIPHALRREFGLTTSRHKIAVYAYYFYRLIQRAEHISMVYNCSATAGTTGEMSRFMTQLLIETQLPIRHLALTGKQTMAASRPSPIAKPADLRERLRTLSPSAINTYLRCQLQFFFQRVARLKAPQPVANIIEPNTLGTVFHRAAELFYAAQCAKAGGLITPEMLKPYLDSANDAAVEKYVVRAMSEEHVDLDKVIVKTTVKKYLKQLIANDSRLGHFRLLATEQQKDLPLNVPYGEGTAVVEIGGTIDRVDLVKPLHAEGETMRIVDYKTGGRPEKAADLEQLFTPAKNHPHYVLQTFVYSLLMNDEAAGRPVMPALFFVHQAADKDGDYAPTIIYDKAELTDIRPLLPEFRERLTALVAEILNPHLTFKPTDTADFCRTCPYADLCFH